MHRLAAIVLILCFLALGTRAAELLHNQNHAREDGLAAARDHHDHHPTKPRQHDENNCDVHLLLHMPLLSVGIVPVLIALGVFVAFLTLLSPELIGRRPEVPFDGRGPPACC